ncbi:hypothetical protein KCU98_g101, partial [Aureobasidium melanogenum]
MLSVAPSSKPLQLSLAPPQLQLPSLIVRTSTIPHLVAVNTTNPSSTSSVPSSLAPLPPTRLLSPIFALSSLTSLQLTPTNLLS